MLNHTLQKFIKDRILLIGFFLLNMICVIAFFHLSESSNTELLYPFSVGIFLLALYLVIDWFRYYPMNSQMEGMLNNQDVQLKPQSEEQKLYQQLLTKIVSENTKRTSEMKEQNKERIYFLSHWMHHLKTPVSVIELMINDELKTTETPQVYERILQENNRLLTSIEQGLTMIRIDRFENDLDIKSVDLLPSLRKLINNRKREFIYNSIFPSIEFEGKTTFIVTDSKWNEVLLDQVISNAIKYSSIKEGSKKLSFIIRVDEEHTTLSIIDEGIGIPTYDVPRVFQPFFTGENGRELSNSTGIGLYLCKKIADRLGQTISIHSEVMVGTTVTIRWVTGKQGKH
ncbi:sensor histidine kinase [Bacillus sp. AK128]